MITAKDQEQSNNAKISRLQALHDPLTELLNRRGLQAALEEATEQSRQYTTPNTLLYLDLDHFKPINHLEGHKAGDEVLIRICNTLSGTA